MSTTLVLCDHSDSKGMPHTVLSDKTLSINPTPPEQNLKLHVDNITHGILTDLNPLAHDLLEIAAYTYYADCSVRRGEDANVYADRWQRKFDFVIPVSNPARWNNPEIKNLLKKTLEFLTGDEFSFTFVQSGPKLGQLYLDLADSLPAFPDSDCLCLFSGGIDSLVGSLFLLKERNERPLLVSHRSVPIMDTRQRNLIKLLQERNQEWQFPHLSVWINRMGNRAVEITQRSRSFLYLSIATAVAFQLRMKKIYICENGVVSLNLPISGQTVGTLLTRTTQPKFLSLFDQFIKKLLTPNLSVENPFIFYTKTQLLEMLNGWNQSELLQATVSCSYTQGRTKMQPQCGTCSQCIGRRFSVVAAGLETHDRSEYYEKDIFIDSLQEGRETVFAEGYVRTAFAINQMADVQFFSGYPELEEAVHFLNIPPDQCGQKLYNLFQRHATEVINGATTKCNEHQISLLAGELPDNCLISMLAHRRHLLKPLEVDAEKIARILGSALRIDFQTEKPKTEPCLQESAQASLAAADERLRRESPMLSYTVVRTKPDFADTDDYNRLLFVELKLLNSRGKLNKIVTEITSRITIYRDQGAFALFVVYDTDDFIIDDEEFVRDLQKHERIKAVVVR